MPNTEEQRQDIIDNCDQLLDGILKPFVQTDDTPEGRMITQLKWLKEHAENHDLPLPVDRGRLATLLYVYTNGELCNLATSPKEVHDKAELCMERLISITEGGHLLFKPEYYPYAIRMSDELLSILKHADRHLDQYEQGFIDEVENLKQLLSEAKLVPPLISYMPDYPNFIEVEGIKRITIDDLPNGKMLYRTVANLFFEGTRPDTWLTPQDADRETQTLLSD